MIKGEGAKKEDEFDKTVKEAFKHIVGGLTSKGINQIDNVSYYIDDPDALKAQARDVPGLTFLPRTSSTAFLLGESRNGSLALYVRARDDAAIASLPLKTVADKCVWAPPSTSGTSAKKTTGDSGPLVAYCAVPLSLRGTNFLDDWYRGVVHTADAWWRVDANADTVELIPVDGGASETFDVENPIVDLKGENIAFMNAEDKTLWLLRIGTAANSASTTRQ